MTPRKEHSGSLGKVSSGVHSMCAYVYKQYSQLSK